MEGVSNKVIFLLVFILSFTKLTGQDKDKGYLLFGETVHEFGTINEVDGPVTHKFIFVNTGNSEIIIEKVTASCGCTTPDWTNSPVAPMDTGYVIVKYDPKNRPGPFNKSLSIVSNAENATLQLKISGNVAPRPKTVEDDFPMKIGEIRFKSRVINMGKVLTNDSVKNSIEVYNSSDQDILFLSNSVSPEYINISPESDTIHAKSKGRITFTYDPIKRGDLGYSNDQIVLFTNEETTSQKVLSIVATVEEYFPPMTAEERLNSPQLSFNRNDYDFGSIKLGEKLEISFTLKNTGKADLQIRKLKTNCSCTITDLKTDTILPGESTTLKVIFDSTDRKGYQYKTITVFSNDPAAPTQVLIIKGKVLK